MAKRHAQKYKKEWEHQEIFKEWLTSSGVKAFCKACQIELNPKKKDLVDHAKCKKHAKNIENLPSTSASAVKFNAFFKPYEDPGKIKELRLAAFVAEHTSIRSIDHLAELLKSMDLTHFDLKLHRTKCSALITEILAPELKAEMLQDVGNGPFSLILDESNDISNVKCLGIIIRYPSVRKEKVIDTMYGLLPLEDCDANGITKTLLDGLHSDKLDITKLVGIGVDGTNTMVGQHHSVATLLGKEVGDHFVVNKCICHSLHLAASQATETLPRHLDFMVKETCSWFSYSHKRQLQYSSLYQAINDGKSPLKLSFVSMTRWLARRNIIGKILDQWLELEAHFKMAERVERCYTAQQLALMFQDSKNLLYLTFLYHALDEICHVNAIFQGQNPNPLKMFDDLLDLYWGMLRKICVPASLGPVARSKVLEFKFEDHVMHTAAMDFGYNFNSKAALVPSNEIAEVKERCKTFLVEITLQTKKRLPKNIETIINIAKFSPTNAVNPLETGHFLNVIAVKFNTFVETVEKCISEWQGLSRDERLIKLVQENPKDIAKFWFVAAKIEDSCGNARFKNIANLALACLSLPLSNASVERLFSEMNNVKSKVRNRLLVKNTENVLLVRNCLKYVREETCVQFHPTSAMIARHKSNVLYNKNNNNEFYECEDE